MKMLQLGNGSAFNTKDTNTSFLFDLKNDGSDLLLFDSGYSVFPRLKELEEKKLINLKSLRKIFISHMDADHIGSLETFLYYQYYINKIVVDVYCGKKLQKKLKSYLDEINDSLVINYKKVPSQLYNFHAIYDNLYFEDSKVLLVPKKVYHYKPCYGLLVTNTKDAVFLSADTIAHKSIEKFIKKEKKYSKKGISVFHDYSDWNEPSLNVHCCEDNLKKEYSKKFINSMYFCHNNSDYNSNWQKIKKMRKF